MILTKEDDMTQYYLVIEWRSGHTTTSSNRYTTLLAVFNEALHLEVDHKDRNDIKNISMKKEEVKEVVNA